MGLSSLQAGAAIRMSFGPAEDSSIIDSACERILACGEALRQSTCREDGAREGADLLGEAVSRAAVSAVELSSHEAKLLVRRESCLIVDIREEYEQRMGEALICGRRPHSVPLSSVTSAMPELLSMPQDKPLLLLCRSGSRSGRLAVALRNLGRNNAWSIGGGIALWREAPADEQHLEQNCDAPGG
jgi:rhodanese-related sulfurtransferase